MSKKRFLPLLFFGLLAVNLALIFRYERFPSTPSPLLRQPVPSFSLPTLEGEGTLESERMELPAMIHFFASWCSLCRLEHGLLLEMASQYHARIYGVALKDKAEDTRRWLERLGNPYLKAGSDLEGALAKQFAIQGTPETFIIDRKGRVVYRYSGALTPEIIVEAILPRLE